MSDAVWLDVLPALDKFGSLLEDGTTKAGKKAGTSTGNAWSKAFEGAAGDGGSNAVTEELQANEEKAKKSVQQATTEIGKARAAQREAAARVILAEENYQKAVAKSGEDSAKAQAAALRLEAARDKEKVAADKVAASETSLKSAHTELKEVTGQLEKATQDSNSEADNSVTAWGKVANTLQDGVGKVTDFSGSFEGLITKAAGAVGVAALFSEGWEQALDISSGTAQLEASLGLTEQQSELAGGVAGSLYSQAYGESMDDVVGSVESVMSSLNGMGDASAAELETVTKQAMSLADAFDLDVDEAVNSAAQLINQGLAGDATEAFDLIASGLQKIPKALRGEVMDATHEYSQFFAQLGLDGPEAMGLLVAASEDGQYGIDKMGDALKELTIRSSDMSTASVEAYEMAGLSAEDMANRFLTGGDTARGALEDLVTGLQGIPDPTDKANAAIALFGTPLEDLSTADIPDFLDQLGSMDSALGDTAGTAADVAEKMQETVNPVDSLKRGFQGMLTEGLQPVVEPLQGFMQWATDTPGVLEAVGVALGIVALAWAGMTLAASPWLAIGAAIAAVIAGIIIVIQNWGTITDWIGEKWAQVTDWIGEKFDGVGAWIGTVWGGIQGGLKAGWDWIDTNVFKPIGVGIDAVGKAFETGKNFIGRVWGQIKEIAASPINFVIETVYTNGIKAFVESVASKLGFDISLPTVSPIKFAEGGGVFPGYAPGKDSILAAYSPGEGVLVPEAVQGLGGPGFIGWANKHFSGGRSRGGHGTSGGSYVGGIPAFAEGGGFWGKVGSWFSDVAQGVGNFFRDPLGSVAELITKPVEALLGPIANTAWGDLGKGSVKYLLNIIPNWFKGKADEASEAGLVGAAQGALGVPYVWGGSSIPPGLDCSGLVYWAAQQLGLDWPRLTAAGYQSASVQKSMGEARPGDLLFWGTPAHHVAIYTAPGQMIHAPQPGDVVRNAEIYGVPTVGTYRGGDSGGTYENLLSRATERSSNAQQAARYLRQQQYDVGGWLQPGYTLAYNGTGKAERIRTAEQEEALHKGTMSRADQPVIVEIRDVDDKLIGTMVGIAKEWGPEEE